MKLEAVVGQPRDYLALTIEHSENYKISINEWNELRKKIHAFGNEVDETQKKLQKIEAETNQLHNKPQYGIPFYIAEDIVSGENYISHNDIYQYHMKEWVNISAR